MDKLKIPAFMKNASVISLCVFSISGLLLGLVVLLLILMRPVADDYAYFSDSLINNPFKFALHYYVDWTGRFMQAFWMSTLYRIFGDSVVTVGGIVQLLLLIGSAIFFSYSVVYKIVLRHSIIIGLGLLIAVFALFMSPSLVDSALWITSSSVYIGSIIALLISLGFAALILNKGLNHTAWYIALGIGTFLAQLFSEPTSLIMIYLGIMGFFTSWLVVKNIKAIRVFSIYTVSAISGFLFMYLSPGTRTRQGELDIKNGIFDVVLGAFSDLSRMAYIFTSYRIVLILIAALLFSVILKYINSKKILAIVGAATIVTALVVPLLLFLSTRYTMGSSGPMRAFTVPATIFGLCVAVVAGLAIIRLPSQIVENLRPIITILLVCTGILSTLMEISPVVRAISIRSAIYDSREESINQQLHDKATTIHFEPLPILLANTEAVDFYYNDDAPRWFEDGFRKYYSIPSSTTILYEKQPEGYCVIEGTPGWLGAKDCYVMQRETESN